MIGGTVPHDTGRNHTRLVALAAAMDQTRQAALRVVNTYRSGL